MIRPDIFRDHPSIVAAMTTRGRAADPLRSNYSFAVDSDRERVARNRARLAEKLRFEAGRLAVNRQVHGREIVEVKRSYREQEGDGMISRSKGWLLAASVADCAPILLFDPRTNGIGAVHSGWRGTAAGVLPAGLERMVERFETRPEELLVWVGPAAGPCCYEVGSDVADRFDPLCSRAVGGGKFLFDNREVILQQLLSAGVPSGSIELDPRCTICDTAFHSWRRDGKESGRMLAVIGRL